jgi:hypothetical protein
MRTTETLIRTAYQTIAPAPGGWVSLADLEEMVDATSEDLAAAYTAMISQLDVHLIPEANQKTLTEREWAAAVRIGGSPIHLLAIRPVEEAPARRRGRRAA